MRGCNLDIGVGIAMPCDGRMMEKLWQPLKQKAGYEVNS
jgi:hypothetical protein